MQIFMVYLLKKIVGEAQQAHASITIKVSNAAKYFPYFDSIISTVLLLTGHPKAALYYISHPLNIYPQELINKEPSFFQSMDIITALTYAKTGSMQKARALYQQIHPSQFYFLSKKTDTILYLFLSQYLNKNPAGLQEQLNGLIAETGFTRLHLLKSANPSIESLQFFSVTNPLVNTTVIS